MPWNSIRNFEEFCNWKYIAAKSKTTSRAGGETERCEAGGGIQVRHSSGV